jgi:HAE1 family hydrophobic/amphiphilic exporter-1
VRFVGQYDPAQYEQMVVAYQNDRPVYLHEVAEVKIDYAEQAGFTKRNGYPAFYITLQRAAGSNTVEILDALNKEIADLNRLIDSIKKATTIQIAIIFWNENKKRPTSEWI